MLRLEYHTLLAITCTFCPAKALRIMWPLHFIDGEVGSFPEREAYHNLTFADIAGLDCLQKKKLLFVGDSTLQELMWRAVMLLQQDKHNITHTNLTGWTEVPTTECHSDECVRLCGQEASTVKAKVRCSSNTKKECQRRLPNVRLQFDFVWSGHNIPTQNGPPGLSSALSDKNWLSFFKNVVHTRGPFDAVVFTSGSNDFQGGKREENTKLYTEAFGRALPMLEPLATKRVFLQSSQYREENYGIHYKALAGRGWVAIDRLYYHSSNHCADIDYSDFYFLGYSASYWKYKWYSSCDAVLQKVLASIC
eukprot:gnl/TRDRNA2_/TRDRNA2_89382_c0_seq1.p1 gnl/TRDRNA2_/TRDRNA2_89382_c0~~gnl/TRDRNA2_/TRDRNA2_89382_c0_seq1.p1  ORF type:complete len:307 (-),score=23.10 gnl/TRDRNA2_/TRDRNA2_89382_c0_seq1:76-996(-)